MPVKYLGRTARAVLLAHRGPDQAVGRADLLVDADLGGRARLEAQRVEEGHPRRLLVRADAVPGILIDVDIRRTALK